MRTLETINSKNTKPGAGKKFMLLCYKASALVKVVFFTDTGSNSKQRDLGASKLERPASKPSEPCTEQVESRRESRSVTSSLHR